MTATNNFISSDEWLKYFRDLLFDERADIIDISSAISVNNSNNESLCSELNKPFIYQEVWSAMNNLPNGESSGIDGIPLEFCKVSIKEVTPILLFMFNCILSTGCLPKAWHNSTICFVHKSGSTYMSSNYRWISLNRSMYKIFSDIINS